MVQYIIKVFVIKFIKAIYIAAILSFTELVKEIFEETRNKEHHFPENFLQILQNSSAVVLYESKS